MSLNKRLDKLEERTPQQSLQWDGRPRTAEAYVRSYAAIQSGDGPDKSSKSSSFDGDDPLAYIEQTIGK